MVERQVDLPLPEPNSFISIVQERLKLVDCSKIFTEGAVYTLASKAHYRGEY